MTRPFCAECDRVRLTADGQVRNCLFARTENDLRGPMRAGASDEELTAIWRACVSAKLPGHGISDPGFLQPARPMSAIGGCAGGWVLVPEFDAIVLAGGHATRLGGADKPALIVAGQSMLAAVICAATAAGARTVIVVGPPAAAGREAEQARRGMARPGRVLVVREEPAGAGPVPALRRGLAEAGAPLVLLLAADLPFLRADPLRLLVTEAAGSPAGAVLIDPAGQRQWLVSCWRTAALRPAAAACQGGSLHGVLGPLRPEQVSYRTPAGQPPPWFDCDTAAELALARRWPVQGSPGQPGTDRTPEARR